MSMAELTRRKFRLGDIVAIVLALALGAFFLFTYFKHPNWEQATGFGPEWQCTSRGAKGGGPDFCIKKPLLAPAGQTAPP